MASIPTSFNPSDYEFLLKSVTEGNFLTKAQSLKRFNTLVTTDKKQFSIYAKRIVLSLQDLLVESKDDINLLACTLALEIINLNPKQIEYYVRTKLLKNLIKNLGDLKPQIRKTSHYCLLAYVKTYKSFDQLIAVYRAHGLNSAQWQLRQKSINSFQSILIMQMKYLNWSSSEFRKIFQLLLLKTKDDNQYVQKASEQCLLSLTKIDEIWSFSKKLSPLSFQIFKEFCQIQKEIGSLQQIKLEIQKPPQNNKNYNLQNNFTQSKNLLTSAGQSLLNFQKVIPDPPIKQSIINRIEEIRRNSQTPKIQEKQKESNIAKSLKKVQSVIIVPNKRQKKDEYPETSRHSRVSTPKNTVREMKNQEEKEKKKQEEKKQDKKEIELTEVKQINSKNQKIQNVLGKRLIDDLKNQKDWKDWKVRLEAVEELQIRFQIHKGSLQFQSLSKTFMPILLRLLADQNFKIAIISLKIIEEILQFAGTNLQILVPQLVDKLSDQKIALRQSISKLIRIEYTRSRQKIWIDNLLQQIIKNPNSTIKQQILGILSRMYEDGILDEYPFEDVIQTICPLMEDLKTKIKIKTLDLLVLITLKTQKVDRIKSILSGKMNQVYYQMYCEKISKELKVSNILPSIQKDKLQRSTTNPSSKRYNKNQGNSTSTSLQRYSHTEQYINPNNKITSSLNGNQLSQPMFVSQERSNSDIQFITRREVDIEDATIINKKPILKSFRRKVPIVDNNKSISNYTQGQILPPFADPEKQLKNILTELKSEDWQVSYEAIVKMRRIIQNHSELLTHTLIRIVMPQILKLAESLRSSLSKNAVIALNQMSHKLKKLLDTELDGIFSKLIKKTLDANSFISDEVKKALVSICSNSNQSRITNLLVTSHTSRALPIKVVIAHIIENIVLLPKFFDKQLDKLVGILVDFMNEGSIEVREKTKNILNTLLATEKGPLVAKLIPQQHMKKLKKDITQNQPTHNLSTSLGLNQELQQKRNEQMNSEAIQRRKKTNKITTFPPEFNEVEGLLEKCESSDWKTRVQGMTQLYAIIQRFPEQTFQYRLNSRIIDLLSQQINDPNLKVSLNAIKIFIEVTKLIPALIQYNLSVIVNCIFNCFASSKPQVKTLSEELFQTICQNIEKWMLLQHICNGCLYGVQKSRITIIQKLIGIMADIYNKKPSIFNKNIYTMINKLADENKPELNGCLAQLIKECYEIVGQEMISNLKSKAKEILNEII